MMFRTFLVRTFNIRTFLVAPFKFTSQQVGHREDDVVDVGLEDVGLHALDRRHDLEPDLVTQLTKSRLEF